MNFRLRRSRSCAVTFERRSDLGNDLRNVDLHNALLRLSQLFAISRTGCGLRGRIGDDDIADITRLVLAGLVHETAA